MIVHALFPTLLLEDDAPDHGFIKDVYLKALMRHLTQDGYSNERTGHVTLHHDQIFEPICVMATKLARQYCEVMQIDPALFDFNVVKTWFNILGENRTPMHNHGDAHISFVYYINVPEGLEQDIEFYCKEPKLEPFIGFAKFNNPAEWNIFNSYAWRFQCPEGKMYLFPAGMFHDTVCEKNERPDGITSVEDARSYRISFAGDILLTYKEKEAKPLGLQPRRNWRTFDGGAHEERKGSA